ncbi:MAG: PDZ domain-containing protein [Candidatus Sumerlaeia bacterium]|nr:PDZ domain-containing protein [Candidatus Sumerlaeia bacterium]
MTRWLKMPKADRLLLALSFSLLAITILHLGVRGSTLRASAANDEEFLRFVNVAAEIYTEIKGKYVDDVESREVLEAALSGMFKALDNHSQYMTPRMLDSLNKDTGGSFSGIGIHITQRQGLLTVIAPIPGSPSARIGLAPWDRIIEIEGETTEEMTLQDAVDRLTGPQGTQVTIKVFREGEPDPLEFTITRDTIKIDSVHHQMLEDNIGYIRIARFSENTTRDMKAALAEMKAQGLEGLVLDMRFNSGGLLREAIEVADLFVPKGELIVSTRGRLRSNNRTHAAQIDPVVQVPTFVLVNEGTASASEIVAGALQDHRLGVVIGPKGKNTFGKGSVQTIEPLRYTMYDDDDGNPRESAMRITTARYYTPSDRTISEVGITPDIGVPISLEQERQLLRRGLYGDTTIPLTREEREAQERVREELENRRRQNESGDVQIQRRENGEQEEVETLDEEGDEPFYARATRPEFVDDDEEFRDILLDEALKQMKIFLILDGPRRDGGRAFAESLVNLP